MRTKEELRLLASAEFSDALANDPELKRLNAAKYDNPLDRRVLLEFLGLGDWRIGALPIRPLTLAKWAFLWLLRSPLALNGKLTEADMDIALYILSHDLGELPGGISDIPVDAAGYARATGLPLAEVAAELQSVVRGALRPLDMLPGAEDGDDSPPIYDAVWCAGLAGAAAREANVGVRECLYDMSMSAVCAYFVSWRRHESADGGKIRRRPDAAVQRKIEARAEEVADEWLARRAAETSN